MLKTRDHHPPCWPNLFVSAAATDCEYRNGYENVGSNPAKEAPRLMEGFSLIKKINLDRHQDAEHAFVTADVSNFEYRNGWKWGFESLQRHNPVVDLIS